MNWKSVRWLALVLTVLIGLDGAYMSASGYGKGDQNNFRLSDGTTVLIAALFMLIITIVAFVLSNRQEQGK